jgi:hypothetical protein
MVRSAPKPASAWSPTGLFEHLQHEVGRDAADGQLADDRMGPNDLCR